MVGFRCFCCYFLVCVCFFFSSFGYICVLARAEVFADARINEFQRAVYIYMCNVLIAHTDKCWSCKMVMLHILCIIDETPSTASHVHGMTHVIRGDYSTLFVWPTSTCFMCNGHQYIILWLCLSPFLIQNLNWKLNLILFMCIVNAQSMRPTGLNERHYREWMNETMISWFFFFHFIHQLNKIIFFIIF